MEWTLGRVSAATSCLPSAAPKRPSAPDGRLAGAFDRARAATCVDPPSLDSLRLALRSREAMAAARASPLGPFTVLNLETPEAADTMRSVSGLGIGPICLIYQALVGGKVAFPSRLLESSNEARNGAGSLAASSMPAQAKARAARSQVCKRSNPESPTAEETANRA